MCWLVSSVSPGVSLPPSEDGGYLRIGVDGQKIWWITSHTLGAGRGRDLSISF